MILVFAMWPYLKDDLSNDKNFDVKNELITHTEKGHNANLLLAVSGPLESFLEWLTANYDYVDGDWYYKTDLDGDNPLSHSNILFCYQAACDSGAVDKAVSGGYALQKFLEQEKEIEKKDGKIFE